jgi:hypothetical protein
MMNPANSKSDEGLCSVKVIDIDMPFGSMVIFMIKWALASIPAAFILGAIAWFVFAAVGKFSERGYRSDAQLSTKAPEYAKVPEVAIRSTVPRTSFELEAYKSDDAKIRDLLKAKRASCLNMFAFAEKSNGSNVWIECRETGGKVIIFIWSRPWDTLAGPYEP